MANELIALLAEGAAEQAILDVLLDNDKLIYNREELLNEEILRERSATRFQRRYLGLSFSKKIKIYRILDSKGEQFKLGKAYQQNISNIINLYTTPEIEILFVILHHDYNNYTKKQKTKLKPSIYVKQKYSDLQHVKNYHDVYRFWNSQPDQLVIVLKEYACLSVHDVEQTIASLLRN
ncbi:hypothetical protein PL111_1919 [Leuconostoc inhae]|uniref:Uncharacterized protein n=1 Tax=Leuconostoc inhae TaxID=178001 RepID=A0AAN2QTM5_9LACO|nr:MULTISPECIES: N-6 DNA methylase [Leuconostoc]MBZ5981673.1 N-6 DNA methylase [Leuconostoc gasicomitatum]CUW06581.1 hypothetical protein PL111_1919 [Leuconostoc inhae]CUW07977.1 hypothetical protein KSL4_1357 [Leuconostoc inhae]